MHQRLLFVIGKARKNEASLMFRASGRWCRPKGTKCFGIAIQKKAKIQRQRRKSRASILDFSEQIGSC